MDDIFELTPPKGGVNFFLGEQGFNLLTKGIHLNEDIMDLTMYMINEQK